MSDTQTQDLHTNVGSVTAPEGAAFVFEEVKNAKGENSLGNVPILVWQQLPPAIAFYGEDSVRDILDGTSLRVSFQGQARRIKAAQKPEETDDVINERIAKAQVDFRPGKRAVGAATPVSRARKAADNAATKLGDKADLITRLLERVAAGEISVEDLEANVGA